MASNFTRSDFFELIARHGKAFSHTHELATPATGFSSARFDIYLTHDRIELNVMEGIYYALTENKLKVYADWQMRILNVGGEVAAGECAKARRLMRQSSSLIYVTCETPVASAWLPWQLGFMDGYTGKCAVLPLVDKPAQNTFTADYPIVKKAQQSEIDKWFLVQSQSGIKPLHHWLSI